MYLAQPLVLLFTRKVIENREIDASWPNPIVFIALYLAVAVVTFGGAVAWHRIRAVPVTTQTEGSRG